MPEPDQYNYSMSLSLPRVLFNVAICDLSHTSKVMQWRLMKLGGYIVSASISFLLPKTAYTPLCPWTPFSLVSFNLGFFYGFTKDANVDPAEVSKKGVL
jgi:hypothetical protein